MKKTYACPHCTGIALATDERGFIPMHASATCQSCGIKGAIFVYEQGVQWEAERGARCSRRVCATCAQTHPEAKEVVLYQACGDIDKGTVVVLCEHGRIKMYGTPCGYTNRA